MLGTPLEMNLPEGSPGIDRPIQVYPMFETALRAATSQAPDAHLVHISELWARFAAIAADNRQRGSAARGRPNSSGPCRRRTA
ncbi:MAG: hypothetical protein R2705_12560 [Ilumatobacteraceae bacterium]